MSSYGEVEPTICLLLVDDHPIVLEGLATVLAQEPDLVVVGVASSGEEALEAAARTKPDVILLDLQIPPPSGADLIRELATVAPRASVIILTTYDDDEQLIDTVAAGALGYLLKGAPVPDVVDAIRRVHAGDPLLEPGVTRRLVERLSLLSHAPPVEAPTVTARELEVLRLLVTGASNREIARRLFISERTVKSHLTSIFEKLNVHDRTAAATAAVKAGLVDLGDL